jgi:hypothetical protein
VSCRPIVYVLPNLFCIGVKHGPSNKVKNTLGVFENRVLRRICGPRTGEEAGENYVMRNFIICTLHQILFG